jgi:putative outer membrane protein, probably involved in nutrient binding
VQRQEWNTYTVIDKTWGDRLMLMPIPTAAMDVNPLLKDDQNDGY